MGSLLRHFVLLLGYCVLKVIAEFSLASLSSKVVQQVFAAKVIEEIILGSSSSKIVRPLFAVNMFFTVFG